MGYLKIHENAVRCAKQFKLAAGELIDALQQVIRERVHTKLNYSSLHLYAVQALVLSEDQAYQFTRVALKAIEIPEIKDAINAGTLNVSNARRILTVITPETKEEWIGKASTLTQRELEKEVVKVHPKQAVKDRIRPLSAELSDLRLCIPKDVEDMIERVKDLESQRTKRASQLIDVLRQSLLAYLKDHDPLLKAKRNLGKAVKKVSVSRQIPAAIKHEVVNRDLGQCTYSDEKKRRCPNRRWLDFHHIMPVAEGGPTTIENLATLCSAHHAIIHRATGRAYTVDTRCNKTAAPAPL